eukprot:scaffold2391_cov21-Tisochrysis_lutea.AAC.1
MEGHSLFAISASCRRLHHAPGAASVAGQRCRGQQQQRPAARPPARPAHQGGAAAHSPGRCCQSLCS